MWPYWWPDGNSWISSHTFARICAAPLAHSMLHQQYRCPVPNLSCIHCLGLPMRLTATDDPSWWFLAPVPTPSLRIVQPALLALVPSPAIQTYPHRVRRPQRVQYRHQPSPQATMRVIVIDLIGWTLPKLCNDLVDASIVWFKIAVIFSSEGALNAQEAFAREETYDLAKLIGVAIRRRAVAQSALRLPRRV